MKKENDNYYVKPKIGVIYKYTSPIGKVYIGQTINEKSRKAQHKLRSLTRHNKFYKAVQEFGLEYFEYSIIIKFKPTLKIAKLLKVLNYLEEKYIKLYDSCNNGYNMMTGGFNSTHSQETKDYLRQCAIEKMKNPERKKISSDTLKRLHKEGILKSPVMTEELKQKLIISAKNKKQVYQYNEKFELLNTFNSISEAAKSIINLATHKTRSNRISAVCNGK